MSKDDIIFLIGVPVLLIIFSFQKDPLMQLEG